MSYAMLEKQLQSLPEEYYEEVSKYVEYLLFREKNGKRRNESVETRNYFGSIKGLPDGMKVQEVMRNEWA
ncbi:MAG: DUF2281 domain-containing protein [Oscillospiraceae bacterium]|nr:DUF2281 domain-containing protein [Oscillospiraceae bacterium]